MISPRTSKCLTCVSTNVSARPINHIAQPFEASFYFEFTVENFFISCDDVCYFSFHHRLKKSQTACPTVFKPSPTALTAPLATLPTALPIPSMKPPTLPWESDSKAPPTEFAAWPIPLKTSAIPPPIPLTTSVKG